VLHCWLCFASQAQDINQAKKAIDAEQFESAIDLEIDY
jgi:hypothetical protein